MVWMVVVLVVLSSLVGVALFAFISSVFISRWSNPEKTLYWCFLNAALTPLRMLRLGPYKEGTTVTIESAMKYAMKKTKLTDFGDTTFVSSYNLMVQTDAHKALRLTNLGYVMYRLELNLSMCRRALLIDYLKSCPEVLRIPVTSPVFVLGLPRTGTTLLHRLLSLDTAAVRAPLLWELLSPVPTVKIGYSNGSTEQQQQLFRDDLHKRAEFVRKMVRDRKSAGDNALEHIHEIGADLPEECLVSLADEIPTHLSFLNSDYLNHEKFFQCIDSSRVINAYRYYGSVLRLLSYQEGRGGSTSAMDSPRRWMLKCPIHLFYIKEIAAVFPDAKLIWTHRHPQSAVPSMCSLLKAVHQMYYTKESRNDALLGRKVAELTSTILQRAPRDIAECNLPCSHVVYEDLIRDPIEAVRKVYRQLDWTFTAEYEDKLRVYLEQDESHRQKLRSQRSTVLHSYTPEEFSLTKEELSSGAFKDYCDEFSIPMSCN